jgi:hypothetical protein
MLRFEIRVIFGYGYGVLCASMLLNAYQELQIRVSNSDVDIFGIFLSPGVLVSCECL